MRLHHHDRLDQVARLVLHQHQRLLDVLEALEAMRQQLARVTASGGQKRGQLLHAQPSARHQAAGDRLVTHAAAPFDARDGNGVARAEVVDVADAPSGLEHADRLREGVVVAAGDDHAVDALAVGLVEDLLDDVALAVVDDVGRAVLAGEITAVLAGADREEVGRAAQGRGALLNKKSREVIIMKRCAICGEIVADDVEVCPVCKATKFVPIDESAEIKFACVHEVGVAKGLDEEVVNGLRANFEGECTEVGMYLAMARVAEREGYPEIAEAYKRYAYEEAEHASKFAELLGECITDSTKKNLELRVAAETGACEGKLAIAKRAKELGYDAIHDTVHEMAKDEARHGAGFNGLLKRYFKN